MWLGCHEESCSIIEAEQRQYCLLWILCTEQYTLKPWAFRGFLKSFGYKAGVFFTCTGKWIIYLGHISWQSHHVRENVLCGHKGDFKVLPFYEFFFSINTNHVFEEDKIPAQLSRKCCTGDGACIFAVDLPLVSSTSGLQPTQTAKHAHCTHNMLAQTKDPATPGNVREVLEEKPVRPVCFLWSHLCLWRGRLRWCGC